MALIRIVESNELNPELSLRATDYINKENMNALVQNRLETGKPSLTPSDAEELTAKPVVIPPLAVGQVWETDTKWQHNGRTGVMRQVRVVTIGDTHAVVENVTTKHRTKVRLAAFRGRTKKDYYPVANGS